MSTPTTGATPEDSFLELNRLEPGGHYKASIHEVSQILQRPISYVDEFGYEHRITAASIARDKTRYAWVECREKETGNYLDIRFDLRLNVNGKRGADWEIETYNPYFGCHIAAFYWTPQHMAFLYREKHYPYICSFYADSQLSEISLQNSALSRHKLADEWCFHNGVLYYRSDQLDTLARLSLPELNQLEPISANEARELGALPPGFDGINEYLREARTR